MAITSTPGFSRPVSGQQEQFVQDLVDLANGNTPAVLARNNQLAQDAFVADYRLATDEFGNPFQGIPAGTENFSDVDNSKDADFNRNLIQTRREKNRNLLARIQTGDDDGAKLALLDINPQMSEQEADFVAKQLIKGVRENNLNIVSVFEQQDQVLASAQQNLETVSQLDKQRRQTLDGKLNEIVQSIGGGR